MLLTGSRGQVSWHRELGREGGEEPGPGARATPGAMKGTRARVAVRTELVLTVALLSSSLSREVYPPKTSQEPLGKFWIGKSW